MSFIIENNGALILSKLTAIGRKKLAKGELTFSYWGIGDSEVDYNYVDVLPSGQTLTILKPKDNNPATFKSFLTKEDCQKLIPLSVSDKRVVECCIRNEAKERGFFSGTTVDDMNFILNSSTIRTHGTVNLSQIDGTSYLDLGPIDYEDGDLLLLKISNSYTGNLSAYETEKPVLYLWYKIKKHPISTIATLDRKLPYFSFMNPDVQVNFYIFPNNEGEPILQYYSTGQTDIVWNSETLEFLPECDNSDVAVLNLNNVWTEDFAGIQSNLEGHINFGSIDFAGLKQYLGYNELCFGETGSTLQECEDKLLNQSDSFIKGIGIIHFTNNFTKNEYGEIFYINHNDNFKLSIYMPTIMWHGRWFGGSMLGDKLGMQFTSTGELKYLDGSELKYYDLIEDENYILSGRTAMVVGRVFPDLKIITIHNEELLAVMSYKSNRNFTLPKLKGKMLFPLNGSGFGLLQKEQTLYMTYALEGTNGIKYSLPQQRYIKFVNNTSVDRDIEFTLEDVNYLPYMRQKEQNTYDGLGFYAHKFILLVQIVNNGERPDPKSWIAIDYTNNVLTTLPSYTINPISFENQVAQTNSFTLTPARYSLGTTYDLTNLEIPLITCPQDLQFGDERFFFGNLKTWIGACIYKSIFNIKITTNDYTKTDNTTWDEQSELYFNEIGIFDDDEELVLSTKLSRPIKLYKNSKTDIEISLDF